MATYEDLEGPSPVQRTTKTRLQQLVFSSFSDFRKENLLYDTRLVVGEEEFRAHKILLAACSKYFFSHFKNSGNDVNSVSVVDLTKFREITPEGIRVALDFMYEGKLPEPGDDNLQKKFRATKEFLRIPLYTDYCDVVSEDVLRDLREFVQYSLQSFRSQKVFFDITIKTKGKKFRAHRILLAACSRYFRSMFTLNFKEGKEHEINLADVPSQVSIRSLKDLIELIYTGEIEINVDNFEELLTASFFLQMEFPQDLCAKFIAANIDLENCADVLRLAEGYGMEEVIKAAYYFMQENYDELSQTEHYKRLPEDLAGLLGFLPRKQLAGIAYRQSNYQSAFNSPDIVLYEDKAWKYYFESSIFPRFTALPKEIADTATFEVAVLDNIIYVIGGFRFHDKRRDFLPTNEVHCYDCVFRAWNESSPMIHERDLFRTITTAYYRGAMGIMLVYDITNEKSFENIKNWIRNIEEHASADVEKMILGNKCDMEDRRQVSRDRGEKLAIEYGVKFMETSAKSSINVEEAFFTLGRDIKAKMDKKLDLNSPQKGGNVQVTAAKPQKSSGPFSGWKCQLL
ncbi:uncharacterized protein [Branchiostoma lanceolatum]|uniref:uncharacterized protein isoform X3 n=1 Tax=Branchiostoma lanceolatum TaxID=7740 RepID=UPI003454D2B7